MSTAAAAVYYATGSRKTSAARIFLKPGRGHVSINGKDLAEFATTARYRVTLEQALNLTDTRNQFDIKITVNGGGNTGQAEAIRHGLARALVLVDEKHRGVLKKAGFLRRDAREVERKKYGRHKARRSTQFSKR